MRLISATPGLELAQPGARHRLAVVVEDDPGGVRARGRRRRCRRCARSARTGVPARSRTSAMYSSHRARAAGPSGGSWRVSITGAAAGRGRPRRRRARATRPEPRGTGAVRGCRRRGRERARRAGREPLVAELAALAPRLGEPVGAREHEVAGAERRLVGGVRLALLEPERQAGAAQFELAAFGRSSSGGVWPALHQRIRCSSITIITAGTNVMPGSRPRSSALVWLITSAGSAAS